MAEAAQAQASAALSPQRDIKQEPNALDHFDFSMADHSTTHFNGPVEPATPTAPNGTPAPGTHGTPVANGTPTPAPSLALPAPPMSPTKRARNDLETSVESPEAKRPKTEAQNDAPATQLPIPSSSTPGQPVTQNQLAMPQAIQSHPPAHPSVASHSHALALPQSQPSSQPTTTPTQPAEQAQAQTQEPVQSSVESHALQEFTAPSQPLEPSSTHSQPAEDDYDEQMNLLVQNALSNINDMMDQFDPEAEDQEAGGAMGGQSEEKEPISFIDEPSKFTHNSFINALGNTAVAMLLLLCSKPHEDMVARLRDPNSEHRRCHMQYSKTLEALKLHYSDKSILLATDYDIRSDMAGTIIQFVNLTQLGEWLLDGSFDSICEADRNLPKVFRDERLGLTQNIVNLMMGIKTQRLIKTVQSKEDKKLSEEELQGIFLESAEKQLEEHGITNLVHGSDKTITSCLSERVEELRNLTAETNIIEKYSTAELLRTFCEYANNQLAVAEQLSERLGFTRPKFEEPAVANEPTAEDLLDFASFFEKNTEEMIQNTLAGLEDLPSDVPTTTNGDMPNPPAVDGPNQQTEAPQANGSFTDYKDFEALVAESTSNYVRTTLQGLSPTPYQPKVPTSTTESMAAQVQQANHLNNTQQQAQQNPYYQTYPQTAVDHHHQQQQQPQQLQVPDQQPPQQTHGQGLPPNQTCSSAQLYEKARQAALSRSTAHTRREGLHSTRRPWSQEEEKALMTGLDMVKGPHWSQILGLFGVNGTLSDILRDRTQVQLKDKARNLKLFFLKTNSEMPFYLNSVTGELKTRAPTQAARKEAEERARQNSHEEQAKLNTIMTYSNGLQQSPQNRTHAGGVVTPAHAAAQAAAQNRTPAQASPPQMSYNAGSIPFSSTQQQPIQGYGTQPVPQVHHAHTQPHTPSPQSQAQPPMTNGSQGSPHEHNDQNVKQESHNQPDTDTYDQQSRALLEQLQRVAHDQVSAQTTPYNTHTSQRFTSPGHEQKASVSQSPAPGSTAIATPSQPQSQQQQASTANQSHNPSQSPAPGQAAPSSSSTPAPPAPAAHMVEAPTSAVAPNQLAPSVEQDGSAPPVDPGAEAEFVGFDADAEAALLRDLQAAMSDP